jgi:predicted nucleic acid-binding protein
MTTQAAPRIVLDASAVVALPAEEMHIRGASLFASELMPFEVTNILRRHAAAGLLDATSGTVAHADLIALAVDLYPYSALAHRVWELRDNLTAYDGSHVALAELLTASLITLHARLTFCPVQVSSSRIGDSRPVRV